MHALEAAAPYEAESAALLIARAADALRADFGAQQARVLVHDSAQATLVLEAVSGGSAELAGAAVPEGAGIAWWAFKHGTLYVPDCTHDERFCAAVDAPPGGEVCSILAMRFGHAGRALGVVLLVNLPAAKAQALGGDLGPGLGLAAGLLGAAVAAASLQDEVREKNEANARLEALLEKRTNRLREALARLKTQDRLIEMTRHHALHSEKMAAIGQLAAGVAHEINNPIGFIASNLNTARDYWERVHGYLKRLELVSPDAAAMYRQRFNIDLIEDDMQRLIDECLEGTERVTTIVRNLKEFVHQGERPTDEADVQQLIDRTVAIALSPYKHKVTIVRDYQGPQRWWCNKQELKQVILNLVVNAAQAIESTGVIKLRTSLRDERLCIDIEDTGCGIPEEHLSKIFEPFFTTKEVGLGTGLGLSTCFHLMKQCGGDIQVRSVVGEGTAFRVTLPNHDGALAAGLR